MLSNNQIIKIVIIVWFVVGILYFLRTPYDHRSHDFKAHVLNTYIYTQLDSIPDPRKIKIKSSQLDEPPLYYVINRIIAPSLEGQYLLEPANKKHINYVRFLSLIYGALTLYAIFLLLGEVTNNQYAKLFSLLFLATTPKFMFLFSTYNNDSLVNMFCVFMLLLSYRLYKNWTKKGALALYIITILALLTKFTALLCILTIVILCLKNVIKFKLPTKAQQKILIVIGVSLLTFSPILIRNFKLTGRVFPHKQYLHEIFNFNQEKIKGIIGLIFRIPSLHPKEFTYKEEWKEPWAYPTWQKVHPSTKKYDFFSFRFVTSIIGEYKFDKPHVNIIWVLFFIHLFAYIIGIKQFPRSNLAKLAGFVILLTFLEDVFILMPQYVYHPCPSVDFRFYAYSWIAWTVLYASSFLDKSFNLHKIIPYIFGFGIAINTFTLLTVEGGFWW